MTKTFHYELITSLPQPVVACKISTDREFTDGHLNAASKDAISILASLCPDQFQHIRSLSDCAKVLDVRKVLFGAFAASHFAAPNASDKGSFDYLVKLCQKIDAALGAINHGYSDLHKAQEMNFDQKAVAGGLIVVALCRNWLPPDLFSRLLTLDDAYDHMDFNQLVFAAFGAVTLEEYDEAIEGHAALMQAIFAEADKFIESMMLHKGRVLN